MNQDLPFSIPRTPTPTKPAVQVESPRVRALLPLCTTHQACPTGFIGVPVGCESFESGEEESSRFGNPKKTAEQSCPAQDTTIPYDPFGFGFDFSEDVGSLHLLVGFILLLYLLPGSAQSDIGFGSPLGAVGGHVGRR
jgi:hypothetical protein